MKKENLKQEELEVVDTKPSPLHTVTPLSKYLAMGLFVTLPFLGSYLGWHTAVSKMESQPVNNTPTSIPVENSESNDKRGNLTTRNIEGSNYKQIDKIDFKFTGKLGNLSHYCNSHLTAYFDYSDSLKPVCLGKNRIILELDGKDIVIATSSSYQLEESYSISHRVSTSTNFNYLEIYTSSNEIYYCDGMCVSNSYLKHIVNLDDLSVINISTPIDAVGFVSWNDLGTRFVFSDNKHWPNLIGYSLDTQKRVTIFDSGNGGIIRPDFYWLTNDKLKIGADEFNF